jgi:dipeptidyl aminopeptidase/acylaminoacyl peptidase
VLRRHRLLLGWLCPATLLLALATASAEPTLREAEALALDRKVLAEIKGGSQILANLTHLCDEIGPRLTGSTNLKKAGQWAVDRMKAYGLTDVHQETWSLSEGWERGTASLRILEPDTGAHLTVASFAWSPGTAGKVLGNVIALKATNTKELAQYKGKLKGAVVLARPPSRLPLDADLNAPLVEPGRDGPRRGPSDGSRTFFRELSDFLKKEEAAAILTDSGKPYGLLNMGGGFEGKDRPSAVNHTPRLFVAHHHYEMLYRLATRKEGRTRVELEVTNKFIAGPIAVHNTIGEIRGSEKPDEVVIVGAHLDSWDLGQGATDNGTGSAVVLEAARALAKSGVKPRRTIRFVLFTGEEQGLLGSRAYVEKHKDELPKISACLVHDTGTGKVTGIAARHRPALQPLLGRELALLKELGVTDFQAPFIGGSDHASFDRAGVPGLMFRQEVAGYRLNHHSQLDTLDRALEADLIQGAQVMAVTALRIANLDAMLAREKTTPRDTPREEKKPTGHLGLDDLSKLVGVSDPHFAPDGRSVVVVVSRPDYEKNRTDTQLVLIDMATSKKRILTHDRESVGQPRWSPSGDRLAFLARHGAGKEATHQVFVLPMDGGDALRITSAPSGVQHFSWKPDGSEIAFATTDEPPNKKEIEKGDDAFEVGNDGYLTKAAPTSTHIWLVSAEGGKARRLTSGAWSLEVAPPPSTPTAPLSWSSDGRSIVCLVQAKPNIGDRDRRTVQIVDTTTGKVRALTDRKFHEGTPTFSPDSTRVAYWYPRDGDPMNVTEIWVAPASGGKGECMTTALDRCLLHSVWAPDGKTLLVGGHDGTRVRLWLQPLGGQARALELGRVCPTWSYGMDARFDRRGGIVFTGSEPGRPTELYYLASSNGTPRRLTDFNAEVAGRALGKVETITWESHDKFKADGVLTYPPDFAEGKKYPLVLLIHGGPQSASVERFNAWAQLIAAHGYVVFEPNYRGSDNLGNAYQRAIFKDQGDGPGRDVMAGLEALKKRGFIDEKRIAVTGWSYGGYMTTWLIGHYHDWKTAIAGAAVTDLADQYNLGDGNVVRRHIYGASPWDADGEKRYREQSPITYARAVKTPTLILATTGDARVTVTQSFKFYHALKDNGVPVKFVAYPVSGHFPGDPVRQKDVYRRWVGWLDEHLK